MNLWKALPLACLVIAGLISPTLASGKKEKPGTVTFHMETDPTDNPKMTFQQAAGGKMRTFSRMPDIGSKDIVAFAPFPADDGSYGILLTLKDHSSKRLAAITNNSQGRYLLSQLNGRVTDGVLIDGTVQDGKLVVWKGATLADIAVLDESYPRIGEEGKKKDKEDKKKK